VGVVLIDGWGSNSLVEEMRDIYNGDKYFIDAIVILSPASYNIPDEIRLLIQNTGFGQVTNDAPRRTRIGFGVIHFMK
jgi:hypothetical protein